MYFSLKVNSATWAHEKQLPRDHIHSLALQGRKNSLDLNFKRCRVIFSFGLVFQVLSVTDKVKMSWAGFKQYISTSVLSSQTSNPPHALGTWKFIFLNPEAKNFLVIGRNNAHKIQPCVVQLSTKPPGHDLPSDYSLALLLLGINFQGIHIGLAKNTTAFPQTLARKGSVLFQWLQKSPRTQQSQVPTFLQHKEIQTPKKRVHTGKLKENASYHRNGLTLHGTCENSGKLKT